jgi:hypothetical protein
MVRHSSSGWLCVRQYPVKKRRDFFPCIAHFLLEPNIDSVITVKGKQKQKEQKPAPPPMEARRDSCE